MKKGFIITITVLMIVGGLFASSNLFDFFTTRMYQIIHVVNEYAHDNPNDRWSCTGFNNEYVDYGRGFVDSYLGTFFNGIAEEANIENGISYYDKNRIHHNDVLQNFKAQASSPKKLQSMLNIATPFIIEGVKMFDCKERIKADAKLLLKNLEGDFNSNFFTKRENLFAKIEKTKDSEFTWPNGTKLKYADRWTYYDIPRDVRNNDQQEELWHKFCKNVEKQIKSTKKEIVLLNKDNGFIKKDYDYGKEYSEYIPVIGKSIRKIISKL